MQPFDAGIAEKQHRLQMELRSLGRVLVAYSGGVDSAYLAWQAHQILGKSALAVIATLPALLVRSSRTRWHLQTNRESQSR